MNHPHSTARELLAHSRREASARDALEVSDHLAGCAGCRRAFAELARGEHPTAAVTPEQFPGADYETLCAYLDGTLDETDREILEGDLRNHPALRAQLNALRQLRAQDDAEALPSAPGNVVLFPALPRWFRIAGTLAAAALLMTVAVLTSGSWMVNSSTRERSPLNARLHDAGQTRPAFVLLALPEVAGDLRPMVSDAINSGTLPAAPALAALRPKGGTLLAEEPASGTVKGPRGSPAAGVFALRTPVGMVVRETSPALRWQVGDPALEYRVVAMPILGNGEAVRSPALRVPAGARELAWTPPAPLERGETYEWQAQALAPDGSVRDRQPAPPQPEARFQVLDAAADAALNRLESHQPRAHLPLAVAYTRAGLLEDAARELRALAADNPKSDLPKSLLRDLGRRR